MNPQNLKDLADSPDIFDACERVGKKLGLHIDQIGEIDAQVRAILRGQAQAKDFPRDIKKYLEIDDKLADQITEEVNQEIFQTLRTKLQSQSTPEALTPVNFSSLERAGDLKIQPEATLKTAEIDEPSISERDRSRLINSLENPTPLVPVPRYEPLPDQLLQKPSSIPEQKVAQNAPEAVPATPSAAIAPVATATPIAPMAPINPPPAPTASKPVAPKPPARPPSSPDPYREPIE